MENASYSTYVYSDGTTVKQKSANSYKYFKVEPIVWRVLKNADGKYMLLAEKELMSNVSYYGLTAKNRTLDSVTIYPKNYKYSNIRAYLNGINNQFITDGGTAEVGIDIDWTDKGFLQQAFTQAQQVKIVATTVDKSAASSKDKAGLVTASSYYCDDTADKIFLLSELEVTDDDYCFGAYAASGSGNARIRKATDFAKANNCNTNENENPSEGGLWWIRSPFASNANYVRVINNGDTDKNYLVTNSNLGIVPALFVTY